MTEELGIEEELRSRVKEAEKVLVGLGAEWSGDAWKDSSLWPIASREKPMRLWPGCWRERITLL